MNDKQKQILEYLETVMDPDLNIDIVTLGFIRKIDIADETTVHITMTLSTPQCPLVDQIKDDIVTTLGAIGYDEVEITLTFDPPWKPPDGLREMLGV